MIIRDRGRAPDSTGSSCPRGCPDVGPLVVKASAGVALSAPVLRAPTAADAARDPRAPRE